MHLRRCLLLLPPCVLLGSSDNGGGGKAQKQSGFSDCRMYCTSWNPPLKTYFSWPSRYSYVCIYTHTKCESPSLGSWLWAFCSLNCFHLSSTFYMCSNSVHSCQGVWHHLTFCVMLLIYSWEKSHNKRPWTWAASQCCWRSACNEKQASVLCGA